MQMKRTRMLVLMLVLMPIGALSVLAPCVVAQEAEVGKEAFLSNGCNRCHAVESEGIEATAKSRRARGPDLSEIGKSREASWLIQYIKKEVQADDREHPVPWKGTTEELEAMASWLASLE